MQSNLLEVVRLFLRLGFTAFGGPAAHISLMHDEVVRRRQWLDEGQFLDLVGATNLIPGPNSTEMVIHLGIVRAGWAGLILGGASFILPAAALTAGLAWAYVRFGQFPVVGWVLYGARPVILAVILQALWSLGRKAIKDRATAVVGLAVLVLYIMGVHEIPLLAVGGVTVMVAHNASRFGKMKLPWHAILVTGTRNLLSLEVPLAAVGIISLPGIFFSFLKIGSVLFGSGYVLLAFLHTEFVQRLGWLTEQQLLDAVFAGQVTPGPVFSTATFIGYLLAGLPGATVATVGIFLPAFVFVALTHPVIPRLRSSPWTGSLLDGFNAASLALMAAVTWRLGFDALTDLPAVLMAALAVFLVLRYKINSTWLILGGGLLGLLIKLFNF